MPLDLNQLRTFLGVARHQGHTRAAAHLHVTQSAVSHAVRKLERSLGFPLIEVERTPLRPDRGGALPPPGVRAHLPRGGGGRAAAPAGVARGADPSRARRDGRVRHHRPDPQDAPVRSTPTPSLHVDFLSPRPRPPPPAGRDRPRGRLPLPPAPVGGVDPALPRDLDRHRLPRPPGPARDPKAPRPRAAAGPVDGPRGGVVDQPAPGPPRRRAPPVPAHWSSSTTSAASSTPPSTASGSAWSPATRSWGRSPPRALVALFPDVSLLEDQFRIFQKKWRARREANRAVVAYLQGLDATDYGETSVGSGE